MVKNTDCSSRRFAFDFQYLHDSEQLSETQLQVIRCSLWASVGTTDTEIYRRQNNCTQKIKINLNLLENCSFD